MQDKSSPQSGSALLSALFIMTLVAIAATAMSTRLQLDIYRTRLTITSDKLHLASQAVTFWAMDKLSKKETILLPIEGLKFPQEFATIYPQLVTKGRLYDLQARFNLNNLQDAKHQASFYRLLEILLKKTSDAQRKTIVRATQNWITPYRPDSGHDEFQAFYLQQNPPYLPSHQLMKSVSEFRLLHGVDSQIYQTLSPYVIALPETTPININTAPLPVLMTLGNGLNQSQVNEIIQARGEEGMFNANTLPLLLKNWISLPNK
ncbi:general secretion pathway protein K [Legionella oakridgensis ATCC 33761 = DSM 21215]|uniref:General secretion pathway protein K n=1 Tax=Legionella oakridgensis ATCC 33761 = DSM 21215 TaxID=1268635 RepID=W0BEW0_9GAMM|nr:type II secretion system minor pseudopilin GspK [Legionella oakridgensis]AHE67167.1 general secretion pathway protein K [Legionella oakridgensis ATCC 33761 = DSM 21215]